MSMYPGYYYPPQYPVQEEESSDSESDCSSSSECTSSGSSDCSGSSSSGSESSSENSFEEPESSSESEPEPEPVKKSKKKDVKKTEKVKTEPKKDVKAPKKPKEPVVTEKPKSKPDKTVQFEKKEIEEISKPKEESVQAYVSPGPYIFQVMTAVIGSGKKKDVKSILERTPLPITLHYLHHILRVAHESGHEDPVKVARTFMKKYNLITEMYDGIMESRDQSNLKQSMDYMVQVVEAYRSGKAVNTKEVLQYFTPEFIAMNVIQIGNVDRYDDIMAEFKSMGIGFTRAFHTAKPLISAYFGGTEFFKNKKRYSFNRDVLVMAVCGGHIETLEYILKKFKDVSVNDDIVMESRGYHPLKPEMELHLKQKYGIKK